MVTGEAVPKTVFKYVPLNAVSITDPKQLQEVHT